MTNDQMQLLGKALRDYHGWGFAQPLEIVREDGYSFRIPLRDFFNSHIVNPLELLALNTCHGRIVDVGAGAGRHSLELQRRGCEVLAIDLLPDALEIMRKRGVRNVQCLDLYNLDNGPWDTILMLSNGLGLAGTLAGLEKLLDHLKPLMSDRGQVLADALDLRWTRDEATQTYQQFLVNAGHYCGEMRLRIKYGAQLGQPFDWLHIDQDTLKEIARKKGWHAEMLQNTPNGDYLARITIY